MRLILLDTAGPTVAVAAFRAGECAWSEGRSIVAGADGWLTPALASAIEALGGLDTIGVVVGPGAFTGLRVGVAQALGLSFARGLPCRAVSSLALRAAAGGDSPRTLAVLDARKGRVYAQVYAVRAGLPVAEGPPQDLLPHEAAALGGEGTLIVGEGAPLLGSCDGARFQPAPAADHYVRAGWPLSASLPDLGPEALSPQYLREPDARPSV